MRKVDWQARAEMVKHFIKANGRRPRQGAKSEAKLHYWMTFMLKEDATSFQPDFADWMADIAPTRRWDSEGRKRDILRFIALNGVRPSVSSPDSEERLLANNMHMYLHHKFVRDEAFAKLLDGMVPKRREAQRQRLAFELVEFEMANGRAPVLNRNRPQEHSLAARAYSAKRKNERIQRLLPIINQDDE